MALTPGTRIGSYEISTLIGVGGMGEVYRATDTSLKRQVAIKVLPESVSTDRERLARFQREAEVLAALNHPNIAQIHGLERADGHVALVMELVEGPTLADRVAQGPIPLGDALPIARQIAEALEAAHEQGIVHRDLKPANIKVRDDGTVKVLDFGLAKATGQAAGSSQNLSQSPTITTPAMTEMGRILGTAAYMSPEQARGRPVDKRADIWAFGCVLYEMLTGRRAFEGEDLAATLAAVIRGDPDWAPLPGGLPASLVVYLRRCLERDPAARVRDIGDVRLALDGAFDVEAPVGRVEPVGGPRRTVLVGAAAAVALVAGLLAGRGWFAPGVTSSTDVTRLTVPLEAGYRLSGLLEAERTTGERPTRPSFALSPNGRQLVYVATDGNTNHLFLRPMGRAQATPLAGTEGACCPIFSPDGRSVGFIGDSQGRRIELATGDIRTVGAAGNLLSVTWAENDTFVAAIAAGIVSVPSNGGGPTVLVERGPGDPPFDNASLLPGGLAVLFTLRTSPVPSEWDIAVQSLETGDRTVVVSGGSDPRYVPTGHLLFVRRGVLMAVPFDVDRLRTTADPVVVVEDVMQAEGAASLPLNTGIGQYSVSRAGTLAYAPGGTHPPALRRVVVMDRAGVIEPIDLPPAEYRQPRLSPDGRRLAYGVGIFGNVQLWVYDRDLDVSQRLTSEGDNISVVWSPDGRELAFERLSPSSDAGDAQAPDGEIVVIAADGSGPLRQLASMSGLSPQGAVGAWSPDGVLVFLRNDDLWMLNADGSEGPRPFLETPRVVERYAVLSPDGRWLAYTSTEAGSPADVYVRAFPGGEPAYRVSTGGAQQPVWSADGRQLFWTGAVGTEGREVWVVDVTATEGTFTRTRPRRLVEAPGLVVSAPIGSLNVSPDGNFVGLSSVDVEPQPVTQIEIVENWLEELTRLLSTN